MSKNNSRNRNTTRKPRHTLLPYTTIQAATRGDPSAVSDVLHHYEGYIAHMSTRRLYDEYGNVYHCVDETMRRRLEIKLITGLLSFRTA